MKLFVNEYKYTTDIISESMAVWWGKKFRNGYISMGIFILSILILFLFSMQLKYLLLEPLPILMIVLFKVKEKRSVKLEQERMKVIYKDAVPSFRVEIGEDIHLLSDKRESCVSFPRAMSQVPCLHEHLANAARVEYPAALLRCKIDAPSACCGVFDFRM